MSTVQIDEDLKQYRAILLNGCAVLGAAHLGFLLTLEHEKKLRFLKVISGASVGSIVALFFLAKIPLELIGHAFRDRTFTSLLDPVESLKLMISEVGLSRTNGVIDLCKYILRESNIDPDTLTFKKLRALGRPVDLVIICSKHVGGDEYYEPRYFTTQASPDMLVLDAIALSVNIPLLFTTPSYKGDVYLDGVLTDELPFDYILQRYPICADDMLAHAPYSANDLEAYDTQNSITNLLKYTLAKVRKRHQFPHRVLKTRLLGGGIMELDAPPEVIDYFITTGIIRTRQFLRGRRGNVA